MAATLISYLHIKCTSLYLLHKILHFCVIEVEICSSQKKVQKLEQQRHPSKSNSTNSDHDANKYIFFINMCIRSWARMIKKLSGRQASREIFSKDSEIIFRTSQNTSGEKKKERRRRKRKKKLEIENFC